MYMTEEDIEREKIARRRKVAEAMLAESQRPLGETQFAGGIAVRRSPFEGLAKIAQAYMADKQTKGLEEEEKALAGRQRADVASAIDEYHKRTTARPESRESIVDELANDGEGAKAEIVAPGFTPGPQDKRAAALGLMGRIGDPRDAGKLLVAEALKTPELKAFKPGDVLYRGDAPTGVSIPKTPEGYTLGNTRFGPDNKPIATAPETKPNDVREYEYAKAQGYKGTFEQFQAQQRAAGATRVSVSAGTEKKYGEQFAGKVAEQDVALLDAARKAPELATRANQVKEVIASGKVITGAGADYRLALGKALGTVGASDTETIANTETLSVNLARNTLDAIKASGLGSGSGFSNADRDFLEKAAGGKITLEAQTISRLADLSHRAAEKSAESWNKRVKDIPDSALSGTGIKRDPIQVSPLHGARPRSGAVSPAARSAMDKYAPLGAQ